MGGQDKIRPLWRHYHTGTKALIFVIDSQDAERLEEARIELHRILAARELQDAFLLVFANKQDLNGSMSIAELEEHLQLASRFPERLWHVQASCATNGEGLMEGLSWLADSIRDPKAANAEAAARTTRLTEERSSVAPSVPSLSASPISTEPQAVKLP